MKRFTGTFFLVVCLILVCMILTTTNSFAATDVCTGGAISVSSTASPVGEEAAKAFDDLTSTKWLIGNSTGWIQYTFGGSTVWAVNQYTITSANDVPARDPKNWTLQGSNNGTSWTTVDSRTSEAFASRFLKKTYSFSNTLGFHMYRLNVTANSGDSNLQMAEIEMFAATSTPAQSPTPTRTPTSTPTPTPSQGISMKILWPAYWYPGNANWNTLQSAAITLGAGRVWAIANPNSGPGASQDINYVNQINAFRTAGGRILGYVSTSYGNRASADVINDINNWYNWYTIDGIFFDEQPGLWNSLYSTYCSTARGRSATALCVGNPGTDYQLSETYYNWMNVVVIWENAVTGFNTYTPPSWAPGHTNSYNGSAALLCNAPSFDSTYVDHAKAIGINYLCIFNLGTWDWGNNLPSYFSQFVNYIK